MKTLLLALLLLSALAMAEGIDITDTGSADMRLTITGTVDSPTRIFIPASDSRQLVIAAQNASMTTDEYGNKATIVDGNYSLAFHVRVDGSQPAIMKDDKFPIFAPEDTAFTRESRYIVINQEIRERAGAITKESRTALEAATALNDWVHSNLEYANKYTADILSSVEALQTRKGVCDEFTNVYVAMARSVGIPTRIVGGQVFSGSAWNRHAYAESKISGIWVPVDPLYGEVGLMGAARVKFYAAPTYIDYDTSNKRIIITDVQTAAFSLPLNVTVTDVGTIAPREVFHVIIRASNAGNAILTPTFSARSTGIEVIGEQRQTMIVTPKGEQELEFDFLGPFQGSTNETLRITGPGIDKTLRIFVDNWAEQPVLQRAALSQGFAVIGETGTRVYVTIANEGNTPLKDLPITVDSRYAGNLSRLVSLGILERRELAFDFPMASGIQTFTVTAGETTPAVITADFENIAATASPEEGFLSPIFTIFKSYSGTIFAIAIAAMVVALIALMFTPSEKGSKTPFEAKGGWDALMKVGEAETARRREDAEQAAEETAPAPAEPARIVRRPAEKLDFELESEAPAGPTAEAAEDASAEEPIERLAPGPRVKPTENRPLKRTAAKKTAKETTNRATKTPIAKAKPKKDDFEFG